MLFKLVLKNVNKKINIFHLHNTGDVKFRKLEEKKCTHVILKFNEKL